MSDFHDIGKNLFCTLNGLEITAKCVLHIINFSSIVFVLVNGIVASIECGYTNL